MIQARNDYEWPSALTIFEDDGDILIISNPSLLAVIRPSERQTLWNMLMLELPDFQAVGRPEPMRHLRAV